jgi:pSer/pThr/pTyr-binding forkhead associated (FHA) protein
VAEETPAGPPRLVWERSDGGRVEFPLTADVMTVGRDETADIRVDEPLVSRLHARIERRGAEHVVIDLGSTNYTRVNGEAVGERALAPGDQVRFGRARCVYLVGVVDPVAGGV